VTEAERDLVGAIRAELAAIEPARRCDRRALRTGLGMVVPRQGARPIGRILVRLAPEDELALSEPFDWVGSAGHCRWAYLRGVFLANGSLSLAGGRIHLEFVVQAEDMDRLGSQLAQMGLQASARIRRGRGVLTWKGSEPVISFLRHAGGTAALLELESVLVTRQLQGQLNRAINAESANLRRSIASSQRQLASIEVLQASGELAHLPTPVRSVAKARVDAPEASLSELARALGTSRGVVQRGLDQLEQRALHMGAE
jgi:DNA-binding protein WhiA